MVQTLNLSPKCDIWVVSCMHVLSVQKAVNPTKRPIFRDLFSMRVPGYKGAVPENQRLFYPNICNKVLEKNGYIYRGENKWDDDYIHNFGIPNLKEQIQEMKKFEIE